MSEPDQGESVLGFTAMNDTHRLDWLERNPWKLMHYREADGRFVFKITLEREGRFSEKHESIRDAIDAGMRDAL